MSDNNPIPITDFKPVQRMTVPSISCYYQNCRSILGKTRDVFINCGSMEQQCDIVAFTETWLNDSVYDAELFDPSIYNVFRKDRDFNYTNTTRGGGVLLACLKSINVSLINICSECKTFSDIKSIDILATKLSINKLVLYLFIIYVPPKTSLADYEILFDGLESLFFTYGSNLLLIGDFNIPEYINNSPSNSSDNKVLTVNNFCNFFNLRQYNSVLNAQNKILDLVLCNLPCSVERAVDILLPEDSYHPALTIDIEYGEHYQNFPVHNNNDYNFKRANFNNLYNDLLLTDWNSILNSNNVNVAVTEFYSTLNELISKHVPKKKICTRVYPVWFNGKLIVKLKDKDKARKRYKKSNKVEDYNVFKELRTEFKTMNEVAYKQYISKIENDLKQNPNNFWSYLKSKKEQSSIPLNMKYNNCSLEDPNQIVSAFADFFCKSCSNNSNNLNVRHDPIIPDISSPNHLLHLKYITVEEIIKSSKKIKANMTMGPDNIPAFIIRDCISVLAVPLCTIFNLIIQTSTFPDIWKLTKIVPVFKKGVKDDIMNYRSINIICNFSKIFEIILYDSIYSHVNNSLIPEQHGFIVGRSTVSNLIVKTQNICEVLDSGGQVDVIYTDFSKAFDRIDHTILKLKLEAMGISADLLNIISSYLHNRQQFVQVRGFKSHTFVQTSGVPQGSILGPLFFVIFINDISRELNVRYLLYADDVKIFCKISSEADCVILQNNLDTINNWCKTNDLFLNISKCNVMSYSRKQNVHIHDYRIDNTSLARPDTIKDLGVIFDPKLTFVHHVNSTVATSFKALGFVVRNMRDFNNTHTSKLLYYSLVRSKLEYASIVWNPIYNMHIVAIEKIQRRFLKNLHLQTYDIYPHRGYPQEDLLAMFTLDSLLKRRTVQSIIFLYKIIHNIIKCEDLSDNIYYHVPRITSRNSQTFFLPTPRTNVLTQAPLFQMCRNYNDVDGILDIFQTNVGQIKKLYQ